MNKRRIKRRIQQFTVIVAGLVIVASVIFVSRALYLFATSDIPQPEQTSIAEESEDWFLLLVNADNMLPDDFAITLAETEDGHKVDERISEPLAEMLDAARADGIMPKITSSYRTAEYQQQLLDEKIAEYISEGLNESVAVSKAMEWVAIPGASEHQTGLAVDISTSDWSKQSAYTVWEWLAENSWKYGFILRYTEEKQHITGIIPEAWHFRYVGKEAAKAIYEQGICLEEYLQQF